MNETSARPLPAKIRTANDLKAMLEGPWRNAIANVLPKHVTPDRVTRVVVMNATRTPILLQCSSETIIRSVMEAAVLGLEPGGALGHCYLVPFKNHGVQECQMIIGYRGLVELARRGGQVETIEAHVVHDGDEFVCQFGSDPKLIHTPDWKATKPGEIVCVYAVAKIKGGGVQYDVMTLAEINAIRGRSRASNGGPWVTDYEEMAKKTVVKRLAKMLPLSVEFAKALEHDNLADGAGGTSELDMEFSLPVKVDVETGEITNGNEPTSKAGRLAASLAQSAPQTITQEPEPDDGSDPFKPSESQPPSESSELTDVRNATPEAGPICVDCETEGTIKSITKLQASVSRDKFGRALCPLHQTAAANDAA